MTTPETRPPRSTPWGRPQSQRKIADGIVEYTTASHGGIGVREDLNATICKWWRRPAEKGWAWYEEDCEWAIVAITFPDAFDARMTGAAHLTARDYWPDEYTATTGRAVAIGESLALRERAGPEQLRRLTERKTYVAGNYTATPNANQRAPRFPDDTCWSLEWTIADRDGIVVGTMGEGAAYGWGRPHCSMTKLVWSGEQPPGAADPRSRNYGMCFDIGPMPGIDNHEEVLRAFAAAADRLRKWRAENAPVAAR